MNRFAFSPDRARRGGINRLVAVLLVLIAVMLVIIAIPAWKVFRYRSEKTACVQAMKSAKDGLIIEYLNHWEAGSVEDAMVTLDEVMPARANICPAGGTVYLVRSDNGIFEPVCGLHDDDLKRRVRLNANRAKTLLEEGLREERRYAATEPEGVEIQLNGRALACERVDEATSLRRGTRTTNGYSGVVALYGVAGKGTFKAGGGLKKGDIAYFVYADEEYCAVWRADDGWTGDAYSGT